MSKLQYERALLFIKFEVIMHMIRQVVYSIPNDCKVNFPDFFVYLRTHQENASTARIEGELTISPLQVYNS
jgi:hypothetical protein